LKKIKQNRVKIMQFKPQYKNYKNKVQDSFNRQSFMHYIGAKLTKLEPGYCEIELPYKKDLTQQHGYFHAGVIGTLADNCGGYAAFSLMPKDSSILTVEYKINFMAPGDGERLIAKAQVIKHGKTLTISQVDVFVLKENKEIHCSHTLMTLMMLAGHSDMPS
jgi:uncharacterized protein (TIGR00369 family)